MPRCTESSCGRWRPERLAPRWAAGLRFNNDWYCSRDCVEQAARTDLESTTRGSASAGSLPPLRLGVLLRHMNVISEENLNAALGAQKVSGRRIGAELKQRGLATSEQIVRALATQANVSYLTSLDLARVANGPSWLPVETVRALGLVPFDIDHKQRKVRVLCSAPVPRSAIRALLSLTGWAPEVYLVDDELWADAMTMYRSAEPETPAEAVVTLDDTAAAASFVAEAALNLRAVSVRRATCERYTWLRVEGPSQVSDVLIPRREPQRPARVDAAAQPGAGRRLLGMPEGVRIVTRTRGLSGMRSDVDSPVLPTEGPWQAVHTAH